MNALTFNGTYFDGVAPLGTTATLLVAGRDATLIGEDIEYACATSDLRVSPATGTAPRFIALPNGGQLLTGAAAKSLRRIPQEVRSEGMVAWLEARWQVASTCLVLLVALLGLGYWKGMPVLVDFAVTRIPLATESRLGEQSLQAMDQWLFEPSTVSEGFRRDLQQRFRQMTSELPTARSLRLEFRSSKVGPNAFALPGGIIVITDGMLWMAGGGDDDKPPLEHEQTLRRALAVLAHEVGHVEHRDAMRRIVQSAIVGATVGAIAGDAGSVSGFGASAPALLLELKHSRESESQADEYAFALLRKQGISPAAFADIMLGLQQFAGKAEHRTTFTSSHPATAERIARARAATLP